MPDSPDMEQVTQEMANAYQKVIEEQEGPATGNKNTIIGRAPDRFTPPSEHRQRIPVSESEAIEAIREGLDKVEKAEKEQ